MPCKLLKFVRVVHGHATQQAQQALLEPVACYRKYAICNILYLLIDWRYTIAFSADSLINLNKDVLKSKLLILFVITNISLICRYGNTVFIHSTRNWKGKNYDYHSMKNQVWGRTISPLDGDRNLVWQNQGPTRVLCELLLKYGNCEVCYVW